MKFTILVDPSLVIITIYLVCLGVDKIFKEIHQFQLFTPKLPPLGDGGKRIYIFSLPYRCYISNLVKIGPVALEKKILTHDGRWTTDDDGCQPIAIGHLSHSGNRNIRNHFPKKYIVIINTSATFRLECCITQLERIL